MNEFVLLTAHDCHLCAHGRVVLAELAAAGAIAWREVNDDSDEGRGLAEKAPPLRPVLFDGSGRVIAWGRISVKRLRRDLQVTI
ncbi:MAG: thioredoxin family protein [Actinobacteria bacterium]|nr:thioredoxin family protein [Actinomycetota bacterium]